MVPNPSNATPRVTRRPRRCNIPNVFAQTVDEHINGRIIRPTASPPVIPFHPWNTTIIRDNLRINSLNLTYPISQLASNIIKQTVHLSYNRLTGTKFNIEFQIINFCAWNLSNDSDKFLSILPIDQQHVHYLEHCSVQDPVCDNVLGNLCIINVNECSDVELHVKVNWRCVQPSFPHLECISVLTSRNKFDSVPKSLLDVLDKIKDLHISEELEECSHDALNEERLQFPAWYKELDPGPSTGQERTTRRKSRVRSLINLYKSF